MSLRDLASTKKPPRERYTRTLTARQVRAMKKRGYDAERELVHMLRDAGYDAIRVPVSAPSTEPLPDVFAIKGDSILAVEVKAQVRYAYYKCTRGCPSPASPWRRTAVCHARPRRRARRPPPGTPA